MAVTDTPTCRRCGTPLAAAYQTRVVAAHEHLLETAPDGNAVSVVLAATSACSWNCLAVLAAQLAGPDADAAVQVVAERERQVTAEGWTPEHDDSHPAGQMATAGICYAAMWAADDTAAADWPWDPEWWKPKDRLRDLVRAGALIAAEADRDVRAKRDRF